MGSQNALDGSEDDAIYDNEMPEVADDEKEDEFETDSEEHNDDNKFQLYEVFTNKMTPVGATT